MNNDQSPESKSVTPKSNYQVNHRENRGCYPPDVPCLGHVMTQEQIDREETDNLIIKDSEI